MSTTSAEAPSGLFAEAAPTAADEAPTEDTTHDGDDGHEPTTAELQAEIAALKQEAAANRIKARRAAADLKKTQQQAPQAPAASDLEAAEARGREAARLEHGIELAQARIEGSLKGVVPDESISDIVEELNLSRYVTTDGKVDDEAVTALATKWSSIIGKKPAAKVSHGRRSETPTTDKSEDVEFARAIFKV